MRPRRAAGRIPVLLILANLAVLALIVGAHVVLLPGGAPAAAAPDHLAWTGD
ncbi:hypothetical protein [Paracraurococcus lichenis]|uniref:Uncharacterized protein n=1 Tax=Paracraurococcus lichenis TaxID=3064888 RepID=A0ABT9E5U8_9PROT|nr:hypothetical protein [Paracraurococcus sp. LOR1-02]MDO9711518.1 hypothetical protein [Paracraurococcus sp. LOR1-02]